MESKIEKYISDCTRNCSNELCSVEDRYGKTIISYREWLTPDQALRAAEIAKEETIEKVCKLLKCKYDDIGLQWMRGVNVSDVIKDFRKAMEDKL